MAIIDIVHGNAQWYQLDDRPVYRKIEGNFTVTIDSTYGFGKSVVCFLNQEELKREKIYLESLNDCMHSEEENYCPMIRIIIYLMASNIIKKISQTPKFSTIQSSAS